MAKQSEKIGYRFKALLEDPETNRRWEKVRRYFFLRESTYDMTHRCNIQCDGCYYYEGEKQFALENGGPESMAAAHEGREKTGNYYVVLAGAEPSLVPDLCRVCHQEIPLGAIASNGLRKIPETVGYKIHISVWEMMRPAHGFATEKGCCNSKLTTIRGDARAVFCLHLHPRQHRRCRNRAPYACNSRLQGHL